MKLLSKDFHKFMKSGRLTKVINSITKSKQKKEKDDGHEKAKRRDRV